VGIETTIWIYWLFCLMAAIVVIANRNFAYQLLSPDSDSFHREKGYTIYLILGWVTTLLASTGYILFTHKYEAGYYQVSDLILFSLFNGFLEQFMFVFWFLLGCYIAKMAAIKNPKLIFTLGYISYAIFSGLIHAFFWFKVLPYHEPAILIMPLLLATMSLLWMWLLWKYRALLAIIFMHIVIDFLTVGHLHFTWFESLQRL
jgi:chlorophyllide a hydrolase